MYSFTNQGQYSGYPTGYTTSLANPTVYNSVQSQVAQSVGAIGGSNPTIYTGYSNGAAVVTPSYPQFSNPAPPHYGQFGQTAAVQQQQQQVQQQKLNFSSTAAVVAPNAAHYASYGAASAATLAQYCPAAVAAVQQQQQQQQQQLQTVSVAGATYGPNITRVTDSYSTYGSLASTGGTYTSLNDYSNLHNLRNATANIVSPSSSSPFVSAARLNTIQSVPGNNSTSVIGSVTSGVPNYSGLNALCANILQPKSVGMNQPTASWQAPKKTFGPSNTTNISVTGPARGRGTFPQNKRTGHSGNRPIGEIQPQFYCEICKITCASDSAYKDHMEGQKHKKKEASQKGDGVTLSKSRVSFRCEVCNVTCTGKDTYESHVRGSKHGKTAALMKKLGKPCAESPTVLAPGEKSNHSSVATGSPIATVGGPPVPTRSVAETSSNSFSSSQSHLSCLHNLVLRSLPANLQKLTGDISDKKSAIEAALAAEKDVLPVGEAYVEEERDANGKLVQYNCKLCHCKFSDPNAKNIHVKGRKHRLQYKLKVNPDYVLEFKPNQITREMRQVLTRKSRPSELTPLMANMEIDYFSQRPFHPPQSLLSLFPPRWSSRMDLMRRIETNEDAHVLAKHKMVAPIEAQLESVEKFVTEAESALSGVSDILAKRNVVESKADDSVPMVASDSVEILETNESKDRMLKGVMRVGILAKNLMLNSDREVQVVLLCSDSPTESLLSTVAKLLKEQFEARTGTETIGEGIEDDVERIAVVERPEESAILLQSTKSEIVCRVVLTSVVLRLMEESDGSGGNTIVASEDSLPRGPCLEALAESRRANWFQVKCTNLQSAAVTLRILRDIHQRVGSWKVLNLWMLELLVEKVLSSCGKSLSPGDALRRVFEAISSGILFSSGPGLMDPCERDARDVLTGLSCQEREDITASAQHALRLIDFNQIHRVLGIERIPDVRPPNLENIRSERFMSERKRQREKTDHDDGEVIG